MTSREIRVELFVRDRTQLSIARTVGVSQSLVSYVIHGRRFNRPVMTCIAGILEKDPATVFPWAANRLTTPDIPQTTAE